MRIAFKEWAIVVDALEQGSQVWLFRKGGIADGRQGFEPLHDRFLLFPTWFHQQVDGVIDAVRPRLQSLFATQPPAGQIRFTSLAEVTHRQFIAHEAELDAWDGRHIYRPSVLRERFHWGRQPGLHALKVRVHLLPAPVLLPALPDYGGCKSWIQLQSDIPTTGSQPVPDPATLAGHPPSTPEPTPP